MGYVIGRGVGSVDCVMFLGMGVGVPYVTVWLGVVIGSWLWVSWWVGLGLDSGSVWGYKILVGLSVFSVLVCGVVVVGYDLVWISVGGLADGWLLL